MDTNKKLRGWGRTCPAGHGLGESKEKKMKLSRIGTTVVAGMLLLAAGAFAQEKGSLNLTENLSVQGKVLTPGNYKLQWEGKGPNVQLNIIRGKEIVATVPATIVSSATANYANAYGARTEGDGSKVLEVYYPEGKKFTLELNKSETANN